MKNHKLLHDDWGSDVNNLHDREQEKSCNIELFDHETLGLETFFSATICDVSWNGKSIYFIETVKNENSVSKLWVKVFEVLT